MQWQTSVRVAANQALRVIPLSTCRLSTRLAVERGYGAVQRRSSDHRTASLGQASSRDDLAGRDLFLWGRIDVTKLVTLEAANRFSGNGV